MTTNDNPPPLTAEDVVSEIAAGPFKGVNKDDGVHLINALIAQQTAAKDARIAELEGQLKEQSDCIAKMIAERMQDGSEIKTLRERLRDSVPLEKFMATDDKRLHLSMENDKLGGDIVDLEAERDALQAKLDEANAQVAMLQKNVIGLMEAARWLICNIEKNIPQEITERLNSLKPTAEQWLAERDAALLKPWREGVQVLREALQFYGSPDNWDSSYKDDDGKIQYLEEGCCFECCGGCTEASRDCGHKAEEALKATEDLK